MAIASPGGHDNMSAIDRCTGYRSGGPGLGPPVVPDVFTGNVTMSNFATTGSVSVLAASLGDITVNPSTEERAARRRVVGVRPPEEFPRKGPNW